MTKILAGVRNILHGFHDTTMFLSLMLWICVAPFILLLTVPFFGWEVGLSAVVIAFFIALALCWGICLFPKIPVKENKNAH
jgi:hypothetical protein